MLSSFTDNAVRNVELPDAIGTCVYIIDQIYFDDPEADVVGNYASMYQLALGEVLQITAECIQRQSPDDSSTSVLNISC